jgi:signal transduction histidine kinase
MDRSKRDRTHRLALAKIGQLERLAAVVRLPRPLNAVIELVLGQIFDVVPADMAAIWLYDAGNDRWYIGGGKGLSRRASEVSFRSDETLHARVGDMGEIVDTLKTQGFRRIVPEHHLIKIALYAPMTIAGQRVGLIALYRNTDERFTDDDLRFVRTVGSHIGMAISFAALEARAERSAVLEERARIGADLHDGIHQILSAVRLYAEELRAILDGLLGSAAEPSDLKEIDEVLTGLESCVVSSSDEIAAIIDHLRRPQPTVDIASHVDLTRQRLEESGIRTTVTCETGDLAHEVADALAWILREASSNVLRHSLAERVTITLLRDGEDVVMTVTDDGVGATAPTGDPPRGSDVHIGRRIMRERAAHVGGSLEMSRGERGTTVRARMPAVPVLSAQADVNAA